ncbi:MAG TPA: hypothetical protein VFH77_08120 [Streptomyces sp.]|nr:hypothetical protein [Streptomyces sp.]
MGATIRTHLVLELLPSLVDLLTALGWQTTAAVVLFTLFVCDARPRPAVHHARPSGTAMCLATLLLLVLLAS